MQSYHLYVGRLESLSLFIYLLTCVYTGSCDCFSHFPLVLQEGIKRPIWVGNKLPIQFS
jgi:hypothetical protein